MPNRPKYYWDACAWIALIKREPGRFELCRHVFDLAQRQEIELWTSAFTLAEVYKRKCDVKTDGIASEQDVQFEEFIMQDCVIIAQVDVDVGTAARRLLRTYPQIGKPQDAIHVATAIINNLDELHTFDRTDLLELNGVLDRLDGVKLKVCPPPSPPPPEPKQAQTDLFNKDETKDAGEERDDTRGTGSAG